MAKRKAQKKGRVRRVPSSIGPIPDGIKIRGERNNLQRILSYLTKLAFIVGMFVFNWLGETSDFGSFVRETWQAAKVASPFAAMVALLLFFDERRERREAQKECNERTIDFINANNAASAAFSKLAAVVGKAR